MKTAFISAGPRTWGSSRMRAYWPAMHMDRAGVVNEGDIIPDTDAYIWQKAFNLGYISHNKGKRHYWDVCDPIWWFSPGEVKRLLPYLTGVVCSSHGLADDFKAWCKTAGERVIPIYTIPDRLDLEHFPLRREHADVSPVRFVWYGVAVNRIALNGAFTNLARLVANGYKIELTIFDDRPDAPMTGFDFPVYHVRWNLDSENQVISNHDIALLPPYPGPWGTVKSDNKARTAAACGLPATTGHNYAELEQLVTLPDMRHRAANAYPLEVFDVRKSAAEWEAILCLS